jgi:hypothetical protein
MMTANPAEALVEELDGILKNTGDFLEFVFAVGEEKNKLLAGAAEIYDDRDEQEQEEGERSDRLTNTTRTVRDAANTVVDTSVPNTNTSTRRTKRGCREHLFTGVEVLADIYYRGYVMPRSRSASDAYVPKRAPADSHVNEYVIRKYLDTVDIDHARHRLLLQVSESLELLAALADKCVDSANGASSVSATLGTRSYLKEMLRVVDKRLKVVVHDELLFLLNLVSGGGGSSPPRSASQPPPPVRSNSTSNNETEDSSATAANSSRAMKHGTMSSESLAAFFHCNNDPKARSSTTLPIGSGTD